MREARRRRQGKTFLLRAMCEATGGFCFAADGEPLHQIGAALGVYLKLPSALRFDSWHEVCYRGLRLPLALSATARLPVVTLARRHGMRNSAMNASPPPGPG